MSGSRRDESPHQEPGSRPDGQRERVTDPAAERSSLALPGDAVIEVRVPIPRVGSADLQRLGEHAVRKMSELGHEPLFGVSGWVVTPSAEPLPLGFATVATIAAEGFTVVSTPHLGRKEHVTILLHDPVDDEQAARFNAAFGAELCEGGDL